MTPDAEVKKMREHMKLSQSELASALQIPLRTLQHIEQGRPFRYRQMLWLALLALAKRR